MHVLFEQIGNQTTVDVKHSSHVKHRIQFLCQREAQANAKHSSDVTCDVFLVDVCFFVHVQQFAWQWTHVDRVGLQLMFVLQCFWMKAQRSETTVHA